MSVLASRSRASEQAQWDLGGRGFFELVLSVAASLTFVVGWYVFGLVPASFALLLVTVVLAGMASPRAFAVLVLVLAPVPSLGAVFGFAIPLGLDPINLLVVIGLGIAAQRLGRWPLAAYRALSWLVLLNFGLLLVAWYRAYGHEAIDGTSLALFVKPAIVVVGGFTVVQLLPRDTMIRTLALGMTGAMVLVGSSVLLQRAGLYRTPNQAAYGSKEWGGLMLTGNGAGLFFGAFAVPTYILLRSVRRGWFGIAFLVFSSAILCVTLSRTGLIAFAFSLLLLAGFDRRRLNGARVAAVVVVLGVAYALTVGQSDVTFIKDNYERYQGDTNAQLSGRPTIWGQALDYLNADGSRWIVGGGLNAFKRFGEGAELHHGFATHNTGFLLLTNGGLVLLGAFLAMVLAMWRAAAKAPPELRLSLWIAVATSLVIGITNDFDFFGRLTAWVWILLAASCRAAGPRPQATAVHGGPPIRPGGRA